jgi:hypothetical protein
VYGSLEAAVEGSEDPADLALYGRTINREDTLSMLRDAAAGAFRDHGVVGPRLTDMQIDQIVADGERAAQVTRRSHCSRAATHAPALRAARGGALAHAQLVPPQTI